MDELDEAMTSNQVVLYIGCALILFYIALVLGRLNTLEQRVFLSLMGMLVIGLSIGASFGLCFFMRIFYADMHPTIPFLMLGIGVDDMFVIVQALENLTPKEKSLPVEQRAALTMKYAGVSITVTSLTDIAAFLIGSTTVSQSAVRFNWSPIPATSDSTFLDSPHCRPQLVTCSCSAFPSCAPSASSAPWASSCCTSSP